MAAEIQFSSMSLPAGVSPKVVCLGDDGYYWWLYRYFETANLPPRTRELIDLYGDSEISGYQLERLRLELEQARFDAANRADTWDVLIGWNSEKICADTERRRAMQKGEMLRVIDDLLYLVNNALKYGLAIESIGD